MFALVVSLRLFPRGLPSCELHDRGLASRRGLQDFEPFRHSMDILSFHDTIGRLKLAFFTLWTRGTAASSTLETWTAATA